MCNYDSLSPLQKDELKGQLQAIIAKMGGLNFLLTTIEKMRLIKPNPLIARNSALSLDYVEISWNKVIFLDKITLLEQIIRSRKDDKKYTLFFNPEDKKSKNVVNLVRTLAPVVFKIRFKHTNETMELKIFSEIEEHSAKINPLFMALFFCYVNFIKAALKD